MQRLASQQQFETTRFASSDSLDFAAYGEQGLTPTGSPKKPMVIDYSKYKTKMCRNFLMGIPCPFEDRCAFAHGDTQIRSPSAAVPPGELPPPSYSSFLSTGDASDSSRPSTPPAYPTRFRYEPYSLSGIIFAN